MRNHSDIVDMKHQSKSFVQPFREKQNSFVNNNPVESAIPYPSIRDSSFQNNGNYARPRTNSPFPHMRNGSSNIEMASFDQDVINKLGYSENLVVRTKNDISSYTSA